MTYRSRMSILSPDDWRRAGVFHPWRGHDIFVRLEGTGAPLVLVHGFPTSSWDWWRVWPALAARYRLVAPDLIGFGCSAKPRGFRYTLMAQADLVEAILAREGVTRYHLVAHDYGLTVAQELLARQQEGSSAATIDRVVLLNGGAFPETHRPRPIQRLLASPVGPLIARLSSYRTFAASMRRIWGDHPVDEDELRAMWSLIERGHGRRLMPALMAYMAERRQHRARWVGALVRPPARVRLVDGLADPVSGAHMVARYRELVEAPDVVELPGVGHYPQVEAPEAVSAAILAFLG